MTQLKPTIDFGYPTEPQGRIPAFHDIEEEAEFWDTHDFTDYGDPDSMWSVHPGRHTDGGDLLVWLAPEERRALVDQARERNIEPSALATVWLRDRLRHELEKKAS